MFTNFISNRQKWFSSALLLILGLFMVIFTTGVSANESAKAARKASMSYSQQWLGWRGVSNAGQARSVQAPTYWSPQHNVMWKTTLPGTGHSSPIVVGDKVFVTASYEIAQTTALKRGANMLIFGLLVLIGLGVIRYIVRFCREQEYFFQNLFMSTNAIVLGVVFVVLAGFILFGENVLDFSRDSIRSWIASSIAMALCLFMSTLFLPRNAVQRLYAGAAFLLGIIPFIYFVPQKDYVFKGGFFTLRESALIIYAIAGFFAILGIILVAIYYYNRNKVDRAPSQAARKFPSYKFFVNLAITGGSILFIIGMIALVVIAAVQTSEVLSYQYSKPSLNPQLESRYTPVLGWWSVYAFVITLLLSVAYFVKRELDTLAENRSSGYGYWAGRFDLLLGLVVFVNINFMALNLEQARAIVSFERQTGQKIWACEELTSPVEDVHRLNSMATPTPVSDGERVYGYFGKSGIVCSDINGNTIWTNTEFEFENIHGAATSPVLAGDVLVILGDQPRKAYLAVLNAQTGETIWKQDRSDNKVYFNGSSRTPLVTTVNDRKIILAWGWEDLQMYDLQTGESLARYKIQHQNGDSMCSSPILYDDYLYLVQKRTILALSLKKFAANQDPLIWKSRVRGPFVSTPVISNELLFTVTEKGMVYCLDIYTGEKMWEKRMKSEFYPSPIAISGRIYLCNNDGRTTVFAAERECRVISESDLGEETFSSFAFADGQLFIRTQSSLYCIQEFSAPEFVYGE